MQCSIFLYVSVSSVLPKFFPVFISSVTFSFTMLQWGSCARLYAGAYRCYVWYSSTVLWVLKLNIFYLFFSWLNWGLTSFWSAGPRQNWKLLLLKLVWYEQNEMCVCTVTCRPFQQGSFVGILTSCSDQTWPGLDLQMAGLLQILTHWGRVTQICVFTLQLCETDDANLRF